MGFQLTPKQIEANRLLGSPATNIMLRGGSRSGKTFLLCRAIIQRALNAPGSRHAIFRFRFNHAKTSVWADTLPKVLKLCFPTVAARFDKTDFFVELPNGSQVWIGGLDDKDRVEKILGSEYATLYFNESSQIPWASVETAMSRLAQNVALDPAIAAATGRTHLPLKAYFDCNPPSKLHWSYQLFKQGLKPGTKEKVADPADYAEMQINPDDNRENLPEKYFDVLDGMSAAKRLRFKAGEWATEVNGALWSLEDRTAPDGKKIVGIDATRIGVDQKPQMQRIVVAVDPSGTKGDGGGDDIGIVVAGKGIDGRAYVLADRTCQLSPEGWGRRAVEAYHEFGADRIVGERNFGGDMVRFVVQTADKKAAYKEVNASRGKVVRAEPVAALYEQGLVSHVGDFDDLEDQMCLSAGTLIETDAGLIPIEEVNTQHRVLTRRGFAPVKWAGYTGHASRFVEIEAGPCKIRATRSHPIFDTDTGEFVAAARVRPTQRLLVRPSPVRTESLSLGEVAGIIGCRPAITGTPRESCFTARFTKRISGLFRAALTCITSTETQATTSPQIWSRPRGLSMSENTPQSVTLATPQNRRLVFALSAAASPLQSALSRRNTAHTAATCEHIGQSNARGQKTRSSAGGAASSARPSGHGSSALTAARTITTLRHTSGASEPVYNLSVGDGHLPEFFANGILVHNCNFTAAGYVGEGSPDRADALVWAITELMLNGAEPFTWFVNGQAITG